MPPPQNPVRAFSPGSTFTLSGYTSELPDPFVLLQVVHHAHNNLSADLKAQAKLLAKSVSIPMDTCSSSYYLYSKQDSAKGLTHSAPSNSSEPDVFYRNACRVLPVGVPYRAALANGHGQLIHPKPNAPGAQTALVIGVPGQHLSTDRDHRIKVQSAWQRGASSHSRLSHPAPQKFDTILSKFLLSGVSDDYLAQINHIKDKGNYSARF